MSLPQAAAAGEAAPLGELEALRERVRELTRERELDPPPVAGTSGISNAGSTDPEAVTPHTHTMTKLVHVARDRPCPSFSGNPGEDALSIEAWITEVRRCWEGRVWTVAEQAIFILDHLVGNAKAEVEFHPEAERSSPEKIFALLVEHFRNSQSYVHSLAQFCQRHQRSDESIREFSYGLKRLMDVVIRSTPGAVPNSDQLLRDQFIEHVRDGALRRSLDQRLTSNPRMTFLEVRAVAVKWEETRPPLVRARSQSCDAVDAAPLVVAREQRSHPASGAPPVPPVAAGPSHAEPSSTQHQLAELTRLVTRLVGRLEAGTPPLGGMGPRTHDGRPICYRCGGPGHIARYCSRPAGAERPREPRDPDRIERPRPAAPAAAIQAVEAAGNEYPLPRMAYGQGEN